MIGDEVIIKSIGYEDLEQFKMLANENGVYICDNKLVSYVSDNQVLVAVKGERLVGALIIDANNGWNCLGELKLDEYKQLVGKDEIGL